MTIQSEGTLTVKFYPVTRRIPNLCHVWCPVAFVVSFKLETDLTILQQKSVLVMKKSNVHMVIGNVLAMRYEKSFVLTCNNVDGDLADESKSKTSRARMTDLPKGFHINEINAANLSSGGEGAANVIESANINYVTHHHFYYIQRI
jgi:hypothetical protein